MRQGDLFRVIVGLMVLGSAALAHWVSPWWLLFTAFIGVNMFQSAFTHFCPMDMFIAKTRLPK
ncbi:MAG: sulfurtransferase [Gemmatimonadota bacterium]|nr:MAG: sulfurtransferase [Gemmatimonadota bacterium]